MRQLDDMPGICKFCVGCLRLEDEILKVDTDVIILNLTKLIGKILIERS